MKTLSKKQVDERFITYLLPVVKCNYERDGRKDKPARCEMYNNMIDTLCRNKEITESQASRYCIPSRLV